ncbi:MAG: NAD-dependent epimerase/dehydratase family protein, partial [Thermoplasmataceae archaeon]
MKALFIGGSGYIGKELMQRLSYEEISYLSRKRIEDKEFSKFKWIEGDITKIDDILGILKDFDEIFYLAGTDSSDDSNLFQVNVKGIKEVAAAIKKLDKNQRLIYFSSINVHYGQNEFLRTKRTGEDNASLVKNHLILRLPFVFGGKDDQFVKLIKDLIGKGVRSFPNEGNICPVHIKDLATTVESSSAITGAIELNSTHKINFVQCMNIVAKKENLPSIVPKSGFFSRNLGKKISEEGQI